MPRKKIINKIIPTVPRKTGPKPGSQFPKTVERELKNEDVRRAIMLNADKLIRAGMILAMGQNFIYKTAYDKTTSRQTHVRVTDPDEIKKALDYMDVGGIDPSGAYYFVVTKEPDARAIDILLNRALGKPKEVPEAPDGEGKVLGIRYISPEEIKAAREALYSENAKAPEPEKKPEAASVQIEAAAQEAPVSVAMVAPE